MKYIDAAFKQLAFAWKLYDYALEGNINLDELDKPFTFQEGGMVLVLPDKVFESPNELVVALENNLVVAFGAAAITLNRCREEVGVKLADPIVSEIDQFASLAYQVRNAFAHDIAEPRWNITNARYARAYEFGGIRVDLSSVGSKRFEYADLGGPDVLFWMKTYGESHVWP
jgi:hypothetical protein